MCTSMLRGSSGTIEACAPLEIRSLSQGVGRGEGRRLKRVQPAEGRGVHANPCHHGLCHHSRMWRMAGTLVEGCKASGKASSIDRSPGSLSLAHTLAVAHPHVRPSAKPLRSTLLQCPIICLSAFTPKPCDASVAKFCCFCSASRWHNVHASSQHLAVSTHVGETPSMHLDQIK